MLSSLTNRQLKFIFGCIVARSIIVAIASRYPEKMALPALVVAMAFSIIYIFGLRKTGIEVDNENIWWDWLRPVHAMLFAGFAIAAMKEDTKYKAWVILALDLILGVIAWSKHHKFLT